ncbi:hypothetical protein H2508_00800 [Parahaliea sp. F7430]|uniref:Uncharacterized protein n=1 Tax=Sediminihaliea albiluteola TaxID=2758564 RepID=A0A7W2TTP2_9GAMM|nr:hypothetical protein [Sediminihaliea albiluteola]MBA6411658.1 hypothetical protein [Sediminihaliea albiluteola]
MKAQILLLSAVLLLALPKAWAQTPEEESSETEGPSTESSVSAQKKDPANQSSGSQSSPFNYEATEKISEDHSVSFPVDI